MDEIDMLPQLFSADGVALDECMVPAKKARIDSLQDKHIDLACPPPLLSADESKKLVESHPNTVEMLLRDERSSVIDEEEHDMEEAAPPPLFRPDGSAFVPAGANDVDPVSGAAASGTKKNATQLEMSASDLAAAADPNRVMVMKTTKITINKGMTVELVSFGKKNTPSDWKSLQINIDDSSSSRLTSHASFAYQLGLSSVIQRHFEDMVRTQNGTLVTSPASASAHNENGKMVAEKMSVVAGQIREINERFYSPKTVKCNYCGFSTESQVILDDHLNYIHEFPSTLGGGSSSGGGDNNGSASRGAALAGGGASGWTSSSTTLKSPNSVSFQCAVCGLKGKTKTKMKHHMREVHRRKEIYIEPVDYFYCCPFCPTDFSTKFYYDEHLARCSAKAEKSMHSLLAPTAAERDDFLTLFGPMKPKGMFIKPAASYSITPAPPSLPLTAKALQDSSNKKLIVRPSASALSQALSKPAVSAAMPKAIGLEFDANEKLPKQVVLVGDKLPERISFNHPSGMVTLEKSKVKASNGFGTLYDVVATDTNATGESSGVVSMSRSNLTSTISSALNSPPKPSSMSSSTSAAAATISLLPVSPVVSSFPLIVTCELCSGMISDESSGSRMTLHMRNAHGITAKAFPCQCCSKNFYTYKGREEHSTDCYKEKALSERFELVPIKTFRGSCMLCRQDSLEDLIGHLLSEHGINAGQLHRMNVCVSCGLELNPKQIDNHLFIKHSIMFKEECYFMAKPKSKAKLKTFPMAPTARGT